MAASTDAILEQIRATQRAMVAELREAAKKPTYGITNPSVLMFGKENMIEGYWRYLSDCNWDLEEALRLMKSAHDWQTKMAAKVREAKAAAYRANPGLFSLRQVGFDKEGRPVLYGCFAQNSAAAADWTIDSVIAHLVHICENAGRTCKQRSEEGGYQMQVVIDCTGFTAQPFQKADVIIKIHQTLTLLYPEVVQGVFVVSYTQEVRNVWSGIKEHFDDSLQAKVKFVHPSSISETFRGLFGLDLLEWLMEEIRANKTTPMPKHQKEYYLPHAGHDPRGSAIYVSSYLKPGQPDGHKPHPGIRLDK